MRTINILTRNALLLALLLCGAKSALAQATLIDVTGETLVNTTLSGRQESPAIDMDTSGNYMIVWESVDQDGDGWGIYYNIYDSSNALLSTEVLLNSVTAGDQRFPDVALTGDGYWMTVWQSNGEGSGDWDISGVIRTIGGATSFNGTIATGSGNQIQPKVAAYDGGFVVTWASQISGTRDYEIYARNFSTTGATTAATYLVASISGGNCTYPDVSAADSTGDYVIVWQADSSSFETTHGIQAQLYDNTYTASGSAFKVNTTTSDMQLEPSVAMDQDGDFVVVWTSYDQDNDHNGVYYNLFDVSGAAQNGSDTRVNQTQNNAQEHPDVTCTREGNFIFTWSSMDQDGDRAGVYVRPMLADQSFWQAETLVNTSTDDYQQFSAAAQSQDAQDVVIAWQSGVLFGTTAHTDTLDYGVYCNTYDPADFIPPVALCHDTSVYLDNVGDAMLYAWMIDDGSYDAESAVTLSITTGSTYLDCGDVPGRNVTLTVTDATGNTSTCVAYVTVFDTLDPTAGGSNQTVYLDASGNGSITVSGVSNGTSTDNCGVTLSLSNYTYDCSDLGANGFYLIGTDPSGNTDSVALTATVLDTISPTTICQDITVYLDGTGAATITAADIDGGSTDNCSISTYSASQTSFTCSDAGANTVTLTVTDGSGNVSSCTSTVTVLDTIAPSAVCQNVTVYLDGTGNVSITAADIDGGSSDNCGSVTLSASQTAFTCAETGANTVTLTVTDGSGNASTCTSTVTVMDTISPTAVCQNITLYLDGTGSATINATDLDNGSSDNCSITSYSASQTSFTCSETGANTVTLTVTDGSGNTASCTSTVTVLDTVTPTAVCQNITAYLDATGNVVITASDIDGGSTDNCSTVTLSASQTTFTCSDAGANTVTLTVTDASGNAANCTSTVTVMDTISPTAVCQNITAYLDGSGNVSITAADIDGGSTDNCGSVTLSASQTSFTCAETGANTVTLTVTDGSGNASTCTSTVTVMDTISPTAVCQNITLYLDGTGSATISATDLDNGSSDNCSITSYSASQTSFTCSETGANTVTLTVTDASGNTATCTSTVTVLDTVTPTAVCQNITAYLDATGNVVITASDIDGGSTDNCSTVTLSASQTAFTCSDAGANSVTLTVTDGSGNTATCTAIVTVMDTISPTAVCQNIVVYLDATGNASITAADIDGGSTDNCSAVTLNASQTAFTCADAGSNSITLTITDASGNTATCTADVNVMDTLVPVISGCPSDTTLDANNPGCSAVYSWTAPTASDNCTYTLTSTHNPGDSFTQGTTTVMYTVTDASGNVDSCWFNVTVVSDLAVTATYTDALCNGDSTGTATATATGGVPSIIYQWSTGELGSTESSLAAGTHTVTVTDLLGCVASYDVTIGEPSALVLSATTLDEMFGNDGSINLTVTGGTPNYTYDWSTSETSQDISNLVGNMTYTVIVTDDNGCMDTLDVYVDSQVGLIDVENEDQISMSIFPNPTKDGKFTIELEGAWVGEVTIEMTDSRGRLIYTSTSAEQQIAVNLGQLQHGTYFIQAKDEHQQVMLKRLVIVND